MMDIIKSIIRYTKIDGEDYLEVTQRDLDQYCNIKVVDAVEAYLENAKLKKENEELISIFQLFKEEIEQLKKENEELKGEVDRLKRYSRKVELYGKVIERLEKEGQRIPELELQTHDPSC